MRARLLKLIDTLFRNFGVLPGFMMACTIGLYWFGAAFNTSHWVHVLQQHGVVYSGGFSEAQTILTVIAETMVAIASLAFATVGVVLTLATSQFGHRLIRSFMRDKPTQFSFGIFVSTFIYSLLVLYEVPESGAQANLPALSVSIAFYLAIIAGATLIYFTNHIAQMIAAPSVIAEVGGEMDETIDRAWPEDSPAIPRLLDSDIINTKLEQLQYDGITVYSTRSGYIQTLDTMGLVRWAARHQAVIKMTCRPGDYLFTGGSVAQIWPAEHKGDELTTIISQSMVTGKRRTPVQDLRFAFNQLAEIEVRAMSPALNDPFTALDCINRIGAGIVRLARRAEPSPWQTDGDGQLRLIIKPVRFDEVVNAAFTPIRNYSRESAIVTLQTLYAFEDLAPLLRTDAQRQAVALQAVLVRRGANEGLIETHDRQSAQAVFENVLDKLNISAEEITIDN
jgi:uncharacterized membrane protein